MKKLIFLLLSLFTVSLFFIGDIRAWMNPYVIGSGAVGGGGNGAMGINSGYSASTTVPADHVYHDKFQPISAGPVNYIHIYGDNGGDVCLSIHSSDGTSLASVEGNFLNNSWGNLQLSSEVTLVAATDYYLCVQMDSSFLSVGRDAAGTWYDDAVAYACPQGSLNPEESNTATGDLMIYVDNQAGDPS